MNYRDPRLRDRLASEYVLGTLTGHARQRFERLMRDDPELARVVQTWQDRFQPLAEALPPLQPSAGLLQAIEQRLGFTQEAAPATVETPATTPAASAPVRRAAPPERASAPGFWQRLFAPILMGALAMGLVLGMIVPKMLLFTPGPVPDAALLPASYVGVLADAQGRHGMAISSLRHGKTVDIKQLQPVNLGPGQRLFLWSIDTSGTIRPVGPLPNEKFGRAALPDTSERLFAKVRELAVSVERNDREPTQPEGEFLFRGLCGKFWR